VLDKYVTASSTVGVTLYVIWHKGSSLSLFCFIFCGAPMLIYRFFICAIVLDVQSFRGGHCNTVHYLVVAKVGIDWQKEKGLQENVIWGDSLTRN
jgi:hypothetical protein